MPRQGGMALKKKILLKTVMLALFIVLWVVDVFAGQLVIDLKKPGKNTKKVVSLPAIRPPQSISGTVTLDISPYPSIYEEGRYLVKYFLDSELLYSTTGKSDTNQQAVSFKYDFDTTLFENKSYTIYVNFLEQQTNTAIGAQKVIINNKAEN